ncbi:MAG TPA: OPT/YSL family transporter, partial [Chthoniobacterales bacterium]
MLEIDLRNPPNEMPDIVGYKPENPLAANFKPYISPATRMRELTPVPLIVGTLLGVIFGASSLYLVLKVGLTVSASIPVAVISITLFRSSQLKTVWRALIILAFAVLGILGIVVTLRSSMSLSWAALAVALIALVTVLPIKIVLSSRDATILENNIVQTAGSAGESIAFGLGVTMPAIMILGFDLEITRVMLVAILGGLLGILMMIPLRRALIVDQHGLLKYPEGTACAEVLKAAASREGMDGGTSDVSSEDDPRTGQRPSLQREDSAPQDEAAGGGLTIFSGFGLGFIYYTAMEAFKAWKEVPEKIFGAPFKAGSISLELNPALLGVGYIIGPRIASIMCGGGVLAYLVLIPAIKFFGEGATGILAPG